MSFFIFYSVCYDFHQGNVTFVACMAETEGKISVLKKVFGDQAIIDELNNNGRFLILENGDSILAEGDFVRAVPLVINGRIKVMRRDASGKELLLYYITTGESCALSIAAGLNGKKSIAYAVADEQTELLALPVVHLKKMLGMYPAMNDFVLQLFHQRFNELILFIDSIAFKSVDFRLLKHLQRIGHTTESTVIETTHQQLADELGTAREVVSRLLKQLEKEGKIKNLRGKIDISGIL